MSLKDVMKDDAKVFTNPDDFGEPLVYTPRNGAPKPFNGLVVRQPFAPLNEFGGQLQTRNIDVYVPNDPVLGVTSVNVGGDSITLPLRPSTEPVVRPVLEVAPDSDDALWHLIVR